MTAIVFCLTVIPTPSSPPPSLPTLTHPVARCRQILILSLFIWTVESHWMRMDSNSPTDILQQLLKHYQQATTPTLPSIAQPASSRPLVPCSH